MGILSRLTRIFIPGFGGPKGLRENQPVDLHKPGILNTGSVRLYATGVLLICILLIFSPSLRGKTSSMTPIINTVIATYSNTGSVSYTNQASVTNIVGDLIDFNVTSTNSPGPIGGFANLGFQIVNSNNFSDVFHFRILTNTEPGFLADVYSDSNSDGLINGGDHVITNSAPISEGGMAGFILSVYIPLSASDGLTNQTIIEIHSSSSNMLNFKINVTNTVVATNTVISNSVTSLSASDGIKETVILDGTDYLNDSDILLTLDLFNVPLNPDDVRVYYDVGQDPDGSGTNNTADRYIVLSNTGSVWQGYIPENDAEIIEGAEVRFVIEVDGQVYTRTGTFPWSYEVRARPDQGKGFNVFPTVLDLRIDSFLMIYYEVNQPGPVNITIYDLKGDLVYRFDEDDRGTGQYGPLYWDGRNHAGQMVAVGLYFIHIQSAELNETRKVIILK